MAEQKFHEKIEAIEKLNRVEPSKPLATDAIALEEVSAPSKVKFDVALQKADDAIQQSKLTIAQQQAIAEASSKKPSPMEMSSSLKIQYLEPISQSDVVQKAQDTSNRYRQAISTTSDLYTTSQKDGHSLTVTPATDAQLSDKLIHADTEIKAALSESGAEVKATDFQDLAQKPLVKYLNMLSNGDVQLNSLMTQINAISASGQKANPEQLFAIQIKLNFVQQQLEFFTNVLNKTLESIKTTMNVQV